MRIWESETRDEKCKTCSDPIVCCNIKALETKFKFYFDKDLIGSWEMKDENEFSLDQK